jgi:DNA repair exonuclease SbcCD ATPase subunit
MRKLLQDYNDYISIDFPRDLTKSADSARNAIGKALDLLENIFEEKAKKLSGKPLKDLQNAFNQINDRVRSLMPQAEMLASTLEELEERLSNAQSNLDRALEARASAVAKFNQLFREPFGEPSALKNSLSSAEATVDSIISMYDNLVEAITERFEGIEPARRDELINFLTAQTASLVALARKRVEAVQVLQEAEDDLRNILSEQKTFQTDLTAGLKNFATVIADLSRADSAATLNVIKTATGLVITQLQSSSSGVDKITKQLQDRLKTIRDFTNNIRTLLARGLNEQYVKQLLGAGPEAAGLTAAALATAGSDQILEVNNLYSEIDNMSQAFGKDMAVVFYQNAVDMATAFRDGAQAEVNSITEQMVAIREAIEQALTPLRDIGANLGNDMMQALVDSIKKRKGEVLAEIQDLANKIAELMAAAARAIGVEVVSKPGQVAPSGGGGFVTPIGVPKNVILEDIANTSADLKRLQDKLAAGGLGPKALENLKQNIDIRKQVLKDLRSELGTATSPTPPSSGIPKSSLPGVTNVNSGAVQITVTNNGATGELAIGDIQSAVTEGMLAALDGRRMVAM